MKFQSIVTDRSVTRQDEEKPMSLSSAVDSFFV